MKTSVGAIFYHRPDGRQKALARCEAERPGSVRCWRDAESRGLDGNDMGGRALTKFGKFK